MDLSDEDLQHLAEADRRVVDPPIHVDSDTWSRGGQLDWWVKEHQPRLEWWGRACGADGRQQWVRAEYAPDYVANEAQLISALNPQNVAVLPHDLNRRGPDEVRTVRTYGTEPPSPTPG